MTDNLPQATESKYDPKCAKLPDAPKVPDLPTHGKCPSRCDCPDPPEGEPPNCLEILIRDQNKLVKVAERAKAFADELGEIQNKVKSAQLAYTQARFKELRKLWKEQDRAIAELIRKVVCAVDCWECLLECRLCKQLGEIRRLEDRLNGPPGADVTGTGPLTTQVFSLYDRQAWHARNVAQMDSRLQRIALVLAAWEKPSDTLGEVLEKNAALIIETQNLVASDPAKVVYDLFMTLIPRHWAIRPRGAGVAMEWKSEIDGKYLTICECPPKPRPQEGAAARGGEQGRVEQSCNEPDPEPCECDEGMPDCCCGPDVGILNLRQRLVGPLPYIVDPLHFPALICCLTTHRLLPASEQFAAAEAELAAATDEIALIQTQIADKTAAIETNFRAGLANPVECAKFSKKKPPATTSSTSEGRYQGDPTPSDRTVS